MVVCIAVLFGMQETFHFMPHLLGVSIDTNLDLPRFMMAALPAVSRVFRWFSVRLGNPKLVGRSLTVADSARGPRGSVRPVMISAMRRETTRYPLPTSRANTIVC